MMTRIRARSSESMNKRRNAEMKFIEVNIEKRVMRRSSRSKKGDPSSVNEVYDML